MSHYPYRRAPPAADSRPDLGTYSSSDHYRPSADHDFYRQPHEPPSHLASSSSSYPSSSSSRASGEPSFSAVRPDGALSLLSSCGLEPDDLAVLAELPEDVLTIESLPRLLEEIKGKKGASEPYPSSSSRPAGSTRLPAARPSGGEWDHLRSRPVQYPLDHAFITPKPLPPEQVQDWQDRWGNPRKTGAGSYKPSSSAEPPPLSSPSPSPSLSSSFSNYVVDYDHRGRPTEYGKKGRDGGAVSMYDRPSSSSAAAGSGDRKPSRFSQPRSADYRFAPSPEEYRPKARAERRESDASYNKKSGGGRLNTALKMPSKKAALDFHGTSPAVFPYSCSLCDITVLSEKFWVQHINAPQHADRQLTLLQLFPDWDCRMETASRDDHQPEKPKDEGAPAQQPQTANPQPNRKQKKKSGGNSKVVCVKFPAHSVDEQHLRKLTEPFGKIVKVIMFPSLAFVELGSSDQAKDLVKYYTSSPSSVQGENITFYISNTFNFLQSSRVLSFTPAPSGDDGRSDLLSIAKRFGSPLYTLFLPSMAFVELKDAADAQKLVDYYSTNILRINGDIIKVTYSGEYNTLMRVSSAKKYEEESSPTKRTRSPSPRRRDEPASSKRRRSGEREEKEVKREGSERRTRSRSSDKSSDRSSRDSRSREKTVEPDKTRQIKTESKADEPAAPSSSKPETSQNAPIKEEAVSSGEESDIEGMEVIGEDGENLEDQDMEILDNTDGEEEEEEEEDAAAEEDGPAETTDSPEQVQEKEMKRKEAGDQEKIVKEEEEEQEGERREEGPEKEATSWIKMEEEEPETSREPVENEETQPEEDEEEPDFPVDLENCITLDELEEDESDDQDGKDRDEPKSPSSRVIYLRNLPRRFYTDSDFVKVMKGFGKVVRYFLIRNRQEGFIEMCSSSEALRAVKEFNCKPVELNGSKLSAQISHKYQRLTVAWKVQSDCESDEEQRRERRSRGGRRSDRSSKSKTSERDESGRKSSEREETSKKSAERKESAKKTPEKEIVAKKTPEKEIVAKKTPEKEIVAKKTPEKEELTTKKTLEKESVAKKTPEKEIVAKKTLEKEELTAKKTLEKEELAAKKTPEKELVTKKTLEKEELAAKKTTEKDLAAEKTLEKELPRKKTPEKELVKTTQENETLLTPEKELEAEKTCEKTESAAEKTLEKAESAKKTAEDKETPKVQGVSPEEVEMEDPEPEQIRDEATDEAEEQQQSEPAGGAVEPHKPTKPVGAEFVRPVVGYFCNLCQVIYADEDEAKQQHCSSLEHYRRYQEHTGKDPWTS
ncbi:matrin 3-like 1.1 isoform X2 [Centroberyx gerrardi]